MRKDANAVSFRKKEDMNTKSIFSDRRFRTAIETTTTKLYGCIGYDRVSRARLRTLPHKRVKTYEETYEKPMKNKSGWEGGGGTNGLEHYRSRGPQMAFIIGHEEDRTS